MNVRERAVGLIGLDWVDGGRDAQRDGGLDCYGVLVAVLGLPDDSAEALANADALADPVPEGEACREGDLLIMDGVLGPGRHVGVVLDEFEFVHGIHGVGVARGRISMWRIRHRVRLKEIPA